MKHTIHPIDALRMKAEALQLEPIVEYIRNNYTSDELAALVPWIVQHIDNDEYILQLYDKIETLGHEVYRNPVANKWLLMAPLEIAFKQNRPAITAKIFEMLLPWAYCEINPLWAIKLACNTRNLRFVDAYIRSNGAGFVADPEAIDIILQEDYVELMDVCLKLNLDRRMRLPDGRNLYEAAISDEMRDLLDDSTTPTKI